VLCLQASNVPDDNTNRLGYKGRLQVNRGSRPRADSAAKKATGRTPRIQNQRHSNCRRPNVSPMRPFLAMLAHRRVTGIHTKPFTAPDRAGIGVTGFSMIGIAAAPLTGRALTANFAKSTSSQSLRPNVPGLNDACCQTPQTSKHPLNQSPSVPS